MRDTQFKQIAPALPAFLLLLIAVAMQCWPPVPQDPGYHHFADTRRWLGIDNAGDVLSNAGFAAVGLWGLLVLRDPRYRLFLAGLVLTAFGSAYYHLDPGNFRLLWDRLPLAVTCAALLAAMHANTHPDPQLRWLTPGLALAAIGTVVYWYVSERHGAGDMRPYILLQAAPLVFVPLWQWIYDTPRAERIAFAIAVGLYLLAKAAEHYDRQIFESLRFVSGHSLKHLLAAAAGAVIVASLVRR